MRKKIFCAILTLTLAAGCKEKEKPLQADKLFADTEKMIIQHYALRGTGEDGPAFTIPELYGQALARFDEGKKTADRQELIDLLNKKHPDDRNSIYSALDAFLKALPVGYNNFARPESLKWLRDPDRSAGVGLVIRMTEPGRFLLLDSLEGSASHREKVPTGVYLDKVDGNAVGPMDMDEIVGRIRGPADSEVKLDIQGKTYTLVRSEVRFQNYLNASWELPGGAKTEYIMLRSTLGGGQGQPGTASQLMALVTSLGGRDSLILDLRKLHQGDFDEAFKIADLFVGGGRMGAIQMRGEPVRNFDADPDRVFSGRVFVIIGKNSSPFAETLAMAMSVSPETILVGPEISASGFVAKALPVEGGVELRLTGGFILNNQDKPLYQTGLHPSISTTDYLPSHPPLAEVDPADPAQQKLGSMLGAK